MPKFNYSSETTKIFKRILGLENNEDIQKFVEENMGKGKFSYHQIDIFIKLFISHISQHIKFDPKFPLSINVKDITQDSIPQFAKCTPYFTNGSFAKLLTGTDKNKNDDKKDYVDKLSEVYKNDLENMEFKEPLIYKNKDKLKFEKLYIPSHDSQEYKNSVEFLAELKKFLNLPNDVEKEVNGLNSLKSIIEEENNNYVITNDNYRKMVLLAYRIKANIPVIIMGDTGCGKTALIIKLNQILNNGENKVEIINIHPGITDDKLCKIMDKKK
jgi:midasin (ATPase involved in ribosome maturation)